MYSSLFLVSLAAAGVLGSALPEPDARHVPPRWRTKATRKHSTKTKFYAIAPGPPSENYDGAVEFGRFHPGLFAPKSTTIPDGSIFGGDGESSSTADPAATTASVDTASAASSSASADWGCNSPDIPDSELLPDASCGIYFDDDLDDFYGHYDFSSATFAAALEDFAPGLPSYAAADFDADDVPQFVTVGGQTFSTSAKVDGPATSFSLLRPRTPQGLPAPPQGFDSIEDFIVEMAARREGQNAVAELQARRRIEGFTTPGRQSDLLNAQGTAMMQARADLAQEKARLALALANAAQARADQAKKAAAGGDAAKVAQIALDRKTLPVLAGGGQSSEAKGVEPLAVGSKVAAAAVGAAAAGDRAGQVRSQAQSAVQNAQQAANPNPQKKKKKLVRRLETLDEVDDANNSDLDSALIAQLLLMGVDEQQNPDLTTSTANDIAPAFAYSTVADVSGRFFLAADDSGTLGLTTTAPSAAGFAPNTFAFFGGALAADARGRLPVYFPEAVAALGVSRFRVAALNDTAFDARAAAAVPVKVDDGYSVLVPVDTEGVGYAFVACDVMVSEGDEDGGGEVRVNKLFVVRDLEAGVRTLLDAATRSEVTGGEVEECFPVALKSPFGSAGL
ncbi:hypothetical protein UCDDS831_g01327 [Diplodia seriata]|uniref:Uncharacterized protein n=1 Tax=Diplodia seriata TaxID=420778 RepID=A0A0G2EVF8_9PEZI|nr:hypothetical protein UCDDS831_g01327 [Diplodia seriata]